MAKIDERKPYDFCVIGAGIAGLTFAALAAASGRRVLVLEQHYLPGGCFTAFKKGPYLFNVALEWTTDCAPGEAQHRLLTQLGLAAEHRFVPIEVFKTVLSPELAAPLTIPTGHEPLRASLASAFPRQSDVIARFIDDCVALTRKLPHSSAILMRHGIKPVDAMLADYFDDPLLRHALYSLIGCPSRGVLLMYMVGAIAAGQMYRPLHRDHRRLGALLHRRIHALGSTVVFESEVSRILVEHGRACGVRLADGREIRAAAVVATTDPAQLYTRLLDPAAMPEPQRAPGLSCFSLFLGLDRPVRGLDPARSAYSLLAETPRWLADPSDLATLPLRVEMQSAESPQLAPAGRATLCAWATMPISAYDHWGQGRDCEIAEMDRPAYEQAKHAATELLMGRLDAAFPGLRETVRVCEAATPFTYKRYTRAQAGSVSGYSLGEMSYLKNRPSATAIEQLFHIGHWVTQSGVNTVMYSAAALHEALCGPAALAA